MEMTDRLNGAIDYVEEHLADGVDIQVAARRAACSTWQLQRMFAYITGMPLGGYIRRRRLSCAALDLGRGEERIIDVARRYGYESPTAFARVQGRVRHRAERGAFGRRESLGVSPGHLLHVDLGRN